MPKKKRLVKQPSITHAPWRTFYGYGYGYPWWGCYPYMSNPNVQTPKDEDSDNNDSFDTVQDYYESSDSYGDMGGFDGGCCDCGGE